MQPYHYTTLTFQKSCNIMVIYLTIRLHDFENVKVVQWYGYINSSQLNDIINGILKCLYTKICRRWLQGSWIILHISLYFLILRLVQITKYKVLSLTHTQTTISLSLTVGNIQQLRNPPPPL